MMPGLRNGGDEYFSKIILINSKETIQKYFDDQQIKIKIDGTLRADSTPFLGLCVLTEDLMDPGLVSTLLSRGSVFSLT
jgi:hypothetical protein